MARWYSEEDVASALARMGQWVGEGEGLDRAHVEAMEATEQTARGVQASGA